MSLRAVFFDLDGTLLDTAPDLAHALNRLLHQKGIDVLPVEKITEIVSDGANAMLKLAFNVTPKDENFAELRQQLLDLYLEDLSTHTRPYPGIEELISELTYSNIDWGIVTNKPWAYTEPLIERFDFASRPRTIVCPDHVRHKKPAPDSLLLACEQSGCQPSEAIYIGDHLRDIECGTNAGTSTISVGYGYISNEQDHTRWGATHSVEHASQLWPIINKYVQAS
ncbi:HAD-IA family hydrolase [Teredinibacter sp. KSP-S5-2]|uniref:HAD family hydrolase n=1 Tax=Teredinibacter sp. KSP-S5-2 TaxID=3034506 RepID=UPI002935202A|nr:HAD-IA family hydrolase [Teredinibacter sp. KSP-S5-2]WNO07881.1 HAD-IA family hydrolase [Teredinibacter sp. KSP-S5-2]